MAAMITEDAIANAVRQAIASIADGLDVHEISVTAIIDQRTRQQPFRTFTIP